MAIHSFCVSVHNSQFSSHYPPFICSSLRVYLVSGFSLCSVFPSLAFLTKCGKQVTKVRSVEAQCISGLKGEQICSDRHCALRLCARVRVCVCLLLLSRDIWDDYQHRSIIFAQDNSGILKLYHFPLIIISSPVNHGNAAATRPWTDSRSIFTIPAIYRFLSAFLSQHTHIERHSFAFISSGTHRATVHGSGEFPVIQSWLKD